MFKHRNYLGETRKKEILRRLEAVEIHLMDLEERTRETFFYHLTEFHHGQEGFIKEPEGDSDENEEV